MTRGLTPATLAAVTAERVVTTFAVEMSFPSGFVRLNGTPGDITIAGNTYLGVGTLGAISAVEEGGDARAQGITVQLSGIPSDSIAVALTQAYQNRAATVWVVPLDAAGAVISDPIVIFKGRIDQMDITDGETSAVTVKLESRLRDWAKPRARRYTNEDQQAEYSGDRFFEFVPSVVEKELIWPGKAFWGRR